MNAISGPGPSFPEPIATQTDGIAVVGHRVTSAPASSASGVDAAGLFKAFQRRWVLALGLATIGLVGVGAALWFFLPPAKFTVEALLLVEAEQPRIIAATKEYRPDPETDRKTQVALIKSLVLSKILSQPDIAELDIIKNCGDPASWLENELKAEFTGKILRLALSNENPTAAATLVKAVTNVYLTEVANKEKAARLERNATLEKDYESIQNRLDKKRKQLKGLATDLGAKDKQSVSLQQRLALTRQSMAEQELLRTQADLRHAMAELKILQKKEERLTAPDPEHPDVSGVNGDLEERIRRDPVVQDYLKQEAELTAAYQHAKSLSRGGDPARSYTKKQLASVQQQRKKYEIGLRAGLRGPRQHEPGDSRHADVSLTTLQDQVDVLSELESDLAEEVSKFTVDTRKLGSQALELESIQEEIRGADNVGKLIGDELEVLKIELNAPDRVRLLKEAKAPLTVDTSRQIKITGIGAGGAFAAIIMLITFWEFRAQRIGSHQELARGLGIRVVGTVPHMPANIRGALSTRKGSRESLWQHQLIESVDSIRIMLRNTAYAGSLRTVLVTSAVGGEGKTSLANHLATSLARSGQKTLLIDGDFRRPTVHGLYDQPKSPGLCELVRGEYCVDDVIRPTSINNLWVITAGDYDDHALAALAQNPARLVFERLREEFDFVVIDSAPLLPVADTLLLAQYVDGALFSVLRDVSQLPEIEAARERISAIGVPILGAVVSGTQVHSYYRY